LANHPRVHYVLLMEILWGADGGLAGQLEGRESAVKERLHEGRELEAEAENCEDS
jgi:hypothetical protein